MSAAPDRETLTPIVARALGVAPDSVFLTSWHAEPLAGGGTDAHIHRIAGQASIDGSPDGSTRSWSLVSKRRAPPPHPDLAATRGHERAALAHQHALLPESGPTAGLVAAGCYAVTRPPDGSVVLWTEDLSSLPMTPWTAADYLRAARHFGRFNAAPLARGRVPSHPWFYSGFLRYWTGRMSRFTVATMPPEEWRHPLSFMDVVEDLVTRVIQLPETWDHPLVRAAYPEPIAGRALRLWQRRHLLLDALDRFPRTLIHGDAHPGNLFRRPRPDGDSDTVAIDWDTVGLGPLGEDAGRLLGIALLRLGPDAPAARRLQDSLLQSYLAGVDEAFVEILDGAPPPTATVDPRHVRFAVSATAALFGALNASSLAPSVLSPALAGFPLRAAIEHQIGTTVERFLPTTARAAYALLDLADEALAQLPALTASGGSGLDR